MSTVCIRDLDKLKLVKLGYGGLVLGSSQFLILPHLPQKIMPASKVVKVTDMFCTSDSLEFDQPNPTHFLFLSQSADKS